MIGRKKKKNKNVLNNIHQLKGRKKKERERKGRKKGRSKQAAKTTSNTALPIPR